MTLRKKVVVEAASWRRKLIPVRQQELAPTPTRFMILRTKEREAKEKDAAKRRGGRGYGKCTMENETKKDAVPGLELPGFIVRIR